jgi:RNA polymerase sigma-70 factor (ECF subfamily)
MEETAVAQVYRQYGAAVWRRCARILRDEEAALDVTQEVFIRCLNHQARLRPGRELLAWLYRVATNLCLNQIRDARVRSPRDEATATEPAREPEAHARQLTAEVLRGLDRRTQELAVYVLVDGMTHAEAAEVAGVSERTVRNCLGRFLEHGRETLGLAAAPEKESAS